MPKHPEVRKGDRKTVHRKREAELRERRRVRGVRAEIHEAMEAAAAMKRSKKKGTADLDANILTLGFERISDETGIPVEQKFRKVVA
jgi:hypothetical protein